MFLPLDIPFQYRIELVTFRFLYVNFRFSSRIFYRGVPSFATDCPYSLVNRRPEITTVETRSSWLLAVEVRVYRTLNCDPSIQLAVLPWCCPEEPWQFKVKHPVLYLMRERQWDRYPCTHTQTHTHTHTSNWVVISFGEGKSSVHRQNLTWTDNT